MVVLSTVDSEMFARTKFELIFANSRPREFKFFANIENTCFKMAILTLGIQELANYSENSRNKSHAKISESTEQRNHEADLRLCFRICKNRVFS